MLLTVVALVLVLAVAALTTVLVARVVQDVHGGLRDVVCGESPHVCE
ncbi:hypothetical protein [Cellulosimicrobium marinum]|nr:hypothetical protein [Cellulosimicrobium marinum]